MMSTNISHRICISHNSTRKAHPLLSLQTSSANLRKADSVQIPLDTLETHVQATLQTSVALPLTVRLPWRKVVSSTQPLITIE
jgi:hypothetical protein